MLGSSNIVVYPPIIQWPGAAAVGELSRQRDIDILLAACAHSEHLSGPTTAGIENARGLSQHA